MPKGYPSPELIQRYYEAYKKDGEAGIRRVLQEQRDKGRYVEEMIRKAVQEPDEDEENTSTNLPESRGS